jgi:hypothetical protein
MSNFYFPALSTHFGKYDSYGAPPELPSTVVLRISENRAFSFWFHFYIYIHALVIFLVMLNRSFYTPERNGIKPI